MNLITFAEDEGVQRRADGGAKGCPGYEEENPIQNIEDKDEPSVPFVFHELQH